MVNGILPCVPSGSVPFRAAVIRAVLGHQGRNFVAVAVHALLFLVLLSSGFAEFACGQQVNRESVLLVLLVPWR